MVLVLQKYEWLTRVLLHLGWTKQRAHAPDIPRELAERERDSILALFELVNEFNAWPARSGRSRMI